MRVEDQQPGRTGSRGGMFPFGGQFREVRLGLGAGGPQDRRVVLAVAESLNKSCGPFELGSLFPFEPDGQIRHGQTYELPVRALHPFVADGGDLHRPETVGRFGRPNRSGESVKVIDR